MPRKKLAHALESDFRRITDALFDLEYKFEPDNWMRSQLYKVRCEVGRLAQANRENKDWPQSKVVYDESEG